MTRILLVTSRDAATLAIAEHTPAQAVAWLVWSADLTSDRADHERRLLDAFLIAMNSGDLTMAADLKHRLDEFDRGPETVGVAGTLRPRHGPVPRWRNVSLGEAWNAAADDVQVNNRARGAESWPCILLLIGRSREAVEWGERAFSTVDNDAASGTAHTENLPALNLVLNGRGSDGMALLDGFPELPAEMPMDITACWSSVVSLACSSTISTARFGCCPPQVRDTAAASHFPSTHMGSRIWLRRNTALARGMTLRCTPILPCPWRTTPIMCGTSGSSDAGGLGAGRPRRMVGRHGSHL